MSRRASFFGEAPSHDRAVGCRRLSAAFVATPLPSPPPQGGREPALPVASASQTSSSRKSRAQPPSERRKVQRAEAVVGEPAHVRLEERTQVGHAVFEHGDAVDPETPGKALVLVRIEPAILEHVRVHHAAAENLQPILALAEADLALVAAALDIDLERRL